MSRQAENREAFDWEAYCARFQKKGYQYGNVFMMKRALEESHHVYMRNVTKGRGRLHHFEGNKLVVQWDDCSVVRYPLTDLLGVVLIDYVVVGKE